MKKLYIYLFASILLLCISVVNAQHNSRIYVAPSGNDNSSNGQFNAPFRTINGALIYALPTDTIIIKPGVYKESITINKALTIASEYLLNKDTNNINNTILDGDFIAINGTLITIQNGSHLKLIGISIKNTTGSVIADQSSAPSLFSKVKFINNGNPGRIMISVNVNSTLEKSYFTGNKGNPIVFLGQINSTSTNLPALKSCIFQNNGSPDYLANSIVTVWNRALAVNNLMFNNYGAMLNGGCNAPLDTVIFEHNTIVNNIGHGIYIDHCSGGIQGFFNNNIIENNSMGCITLISNSSGYSVINLKNNKLDTMPYFTNKTNQYNVKWNDNDTISGYEFQYPISNYNELRIKANSKLIGKGFKGIYKNSLFDFDGNPRPNPIGSNPDIGAFEHSSGVVSNLSDVIIPLNSLNVYPNPVSTELYFELENIEKHTVKLINTLGQTFTVYSFGLIDVSQFNNGVYLLYIYDSNNKLISINKVSIIK